MALAEELARGGESDAGRILAAVRALYAAAMPSGTVDYLACVDPGTMEPKTTVAGPTLFAAAVQFAAARLIDNRFVDAKTASW